MAFVSTWIDFFSHHKEAEVLVIGFLMIVFFIWDKFRQDVIALCVLVLLGLFNLVPATQIFSGFSSEAVIALIGVMILGRGIEKAGLISLISNFIVQRSEGNQKKAFIYLAIFSGVLAGFFRSIGGFALLLPMIHRMALFLNIPKSRLYLPLGFCAITGGTLTLVGSGPMLMLNDFLRHTGTYLTLVPVKQIGFFTVTPMGICLLIGVILFFIFFGHKVLPTRKEQPAELGVNPEVFRKTYGYGGQFYELKFLPNSPLKELNLREIEDKIGENNVCIVGVFSAGEMYLPPLRKINLTPSARLAVSGDEISVRNFAEKYGLRIRESLKIFADILNPMRSGFSEIVIPPGSPLIGQTMNDLHMRRQHQVQVLSVFRGQNFYHGESMKSMTIRSGDALGIFSEWTALQNLEKHHEFAIVTTEYPRFTYLKNKRTPALFCCFLSLILILFSPLNIAESLLMGAVGMILLNIIGIDEIYKSLSWKTVFLMAGLIPFGLAVQYSGLANELAKIILNWVGSESGWSGFLVLAILALLAGFFALLMTNVGATVALVPVAIALANSLHADPRVFAIVTALGTSNAFILPTHQVSTLITGGGGYTAWDFLRIGFWVSLIYWVILMASAYFFLVFL